MISTTQDIAENILRSVDLIKNSHQVVVLTGAGISTPSGIPDFRSPGIGLWTRFLPMEVASLTAFRHDPENFYSWLHPLTASLLSAKPNPAHYALAELQASGYISTIITQNIDGLHTQAGAINVLELHGSMNSLTCINCFQQVPSEGLIHEFVEHCTVPRCKDCGGIMKPDVILYEEQLPVKTWNKAEETSRRCDLMLIAGTSLEVMPSAKLPILALENGASIIIINNMPTYVDVRADVIIREDVAMILPVILQEVSGA
jgi:NAD-dependent deacetylase